MVEFFRKSSAEVSSTHSKKMVTLMLETDTRHFGDKKKLTTVSAFSHQHALSFFIILTHVRDDTTINLCSYRGPE